MAEIFSEKKDFSLPSDSYRLTIVYRRGRGRRILWDHVVFRGEGSGAQSSLTEYRGDYRKLTASKKGSVLSLKTFGEIR